MKITMKKVVEEFDPRDYTNQQGKTTRLFKLKADVDIDGDSEDGVAITAWGEKALEQFKEGAALDGKKREDPRYGIEYTVFAPRPAFGSKGGFGGGYKGKSASEQRAIMLQNMCGHAVEIVKENAITNKTVVKADDVIKCTINLFNALWAHSQKEG